MAMYLDTGLGASVFAGGINGAMNPTATPGSPQASGLTVGQQAFGTTAGGASGKSLGFYGVISGGVLSLGLLIFIWWSLPR
jgi:hypothetical protein